MVCPGAHSMHNRGSRKEGRKTNSQLAAIAKEVTIMAKDEEATVKDIDAANDAAVSEVTSTVEVDEAEAKAAAIAKERKEMMDQARAAARATAREAEASTKSTMAEKGTPEIASAPPIEEVTQSTEAEAEAAF